MEFLCTSEIGLLDFQEDLVDRLRGGAGKGYPLLTGFPGDPVSASRSPMGVEGKVDGMVGSLGCHRHGCGLMIRLRRMVLPSGSKPIVIGAAGMPLGCSEPNLRRRPSS